MLSILSIDLCPTYQKPYRQGQLDQQPGMRLGDNECVSWRGLHCFDSICAFNCFTNPRV